MELLDFAFVAETITPPPIQKIYTLSFHTIKQFPSAIRGAHKLFLFLGFDLLGGCGGVLGHLIRNHGDAAEIALSA